MAKREPTKTEAIRQVDRAAKIAKWERKSAIPLGILALLFLAFWAMQVLLPVTQLEWEILEVAIILIWVGFIVDFVVRYLYHPDKIRFMRNNVIEFLALVLPAFRVFRMLRVITAIGMFTRVAQTLQARVNIYIAIVLPMMVFAGALGVYEAEHDVPSATIKSFTDALWWCCVTVFTVGYGDLYPVTLEGRVIAVLMMLGGFGLISVVTANLASYFLKQVK